MLTKEPKGTPKGTHTHNICTFYCYYYYYYSYYYGQRGSFASPRGTNNVMANTAMLPAVARLGGWVGLHHHVSLHSSGLFLGRVHKKMIIDRS